MRTLCLFLFLIPFSSISQNIEPPVPQEPLVDVMILVSDQETGIPIPGAKVNLIGSDGSNYQLTTNAQGQINLQERRDGERFVRPGYTWTIEVEGVEHIYMSSHDAFTSETDVNTRIIRDIRILNVCTCCGTRPTTLVLEDPGCVFRRDGYPQWCLCRPIDETVLDTLIKILEEDPLRIMRIDFHTDSRGCGEDNKVRSQKHADNFKAFLEHSYDFEGLEFIEFKGMGEDFPIKEVSTEEFLLMSREEMEEHHQSNRRIEIWMQY